MNYSNILRNYDLKVTPQRLAIVQELYVCGHLNIDQLYNKLLDKFPSISLATIYKNMNAMIEKIFVQEVKIPNEKSVYELTKENHAHFVCDCCKKIEDVQIDSTNLLKQVQSSLHYTINSASLIFNGVCSSCQNK